MPGGCLRRNSLSPDLLPVAVLDFPSPVLFQSRPEEQHCHDDGNPGNRELPQRQRECQSRDDEPDDSQDDHLPVTSSSVRGKAGSAAGTLTKGTSVIVPSAASSARYRT